MYTGFVFANICGFVVTVNSNNVYYMVTVCRAEACVRRCCHDKFKLLMFSPPAASRPLMQHRSKTQTCFFPYVCVYILLKTTHLRKFTALLFADFKRKPVIKHETTISRSETTK